MGEEVEIKLLADPAVLRRLRRHPLVRERKAGRPSSLHQRTIYFDTPSHDLAGRGIALRVRTSGRRHVQTVKTMGDGAGFARGEWEWEIPDERPQTDLLAAAGLGELVAAGALAALVPLFRTEVRRTAYRLHDEAGEVELDLDEGVLVAGDRQQPIAEAELELVRGDSRLLFDLALALGRDLPLRLGLASKAERGFALVTGEAPRPRKGRYQALGPELPAAAAVKVIARSCLTHLLTNHEVFLATADAEAVHQMRVALRRLRALIGLFSHLVAGPDTDALRGELRWLLSHLGPLRDSDVFVAEIFAPVAAAFPGDPGFAALGAAFEQHRGPVLAAARAALHSPRFTALVLGLGRWAEGGEWDRAERRALGIPLDRPIGAVARELLGQRHRKLRKAGRKLAKLSPEQRHRLRILAKKARYAGEALASLFPEKRTRRHLAALAALQDLLGALNDIAVAARLIGETVDLAADAATAWAAGAVAGWHAARQQGLLQRADALWGDFRRRPAFWQE